MRKKPKSPWLFAALMTVVVAVVEAGTVLHLVPGTTRVDVGALLFTGFLAGLFTGFHAAGRSAGSNAPS
ncbi:MAG: hypothetical protein FJ280_06470 [Planctomycetes bacterium]|nr:hypothetical protein [Planctomycetota bacterium]